MNFALIIFAIVVLSDKLDGIFARVMEQITKFGRIYDSFTDFTLVISSGIAFYLLDLLSLSWIIIFLIPSIALTITKITYFSKLREMHSNPLGKVVIGISYVVVVAIIIDFIYTFQLLALLAILAYVYMVVDIYKNLKIKNSKSF